MRKAFLAYMAALCVLGGGAAQAQDWPTRALTMINPFAPGGGLRHARNPRSTTIAAKISAR